MNDKYISSSASLIDMQKEISSLKLQLALNEKILKSFTDDLINNIALVRSLITLLEINTTIDVSLLDQFTEEQKEILIDKLINSV